MSRQVSPRVPSQDYREMLDCLKSHRRELVAFAQNPARLINKQIADIERLELLLVGERARLTELYARRDSIDERIAAVDVRIAEVRNQVVIRSRMEQLQKLKDLHRQIKAMEADLGQHVTEDDIVS